MLKFFISLFLIFFLIGTGIRSVFASEENHKRVITVGTDQVVNDDYFAAGSEISILGKINGDAYIAGGNVNVQGEINGDLLIAGGNVNIGGKISQDVRILGGQVTIASAEVAGNLTVVGGSVNILKSANIKGSLTSAAGTLSTFAHFGKGASFAVGNGSLGGQINGDVRAAAGQMTLLDQSEIGGDLTYLSDKEAKIVPGAQVGGKTIHNFPKKPTREEKERAKRFFSGLHLSVKIIGFLSSFVAGIILLKIAPNFLEKTTKIFLEKPLKSFGVGLAAIILVPVVSLLLIVIILGIPLGLISIVLFLILVYFAKIIASFAIGEKVLGLFGNKGQVFALGVGLLTLAILTEIPILGIVIAVLAILAGTGSLVITKASLASELRSKKII